MMIPKVSQGENLVLRVAHTQSPVVFSLHSLLTLTCVGGKPRGSFDVSPGLGAVREW